MNWTADFSHVILEMCLDGIVIGTDKISWPSWLVDQTIANYHANNQQNLKMYIIHGFGK
jgi:hypothetical protein